MCFRQDRLPGQFFDIIILGVIDVDFDLSDDLDQGFCQRFQQSAYTAFYGVYGTLGIQTVSGSDQVIDGLGLGEIHLAVQVCPLCKLTALCLTCTIAETQLQYSSGDIQTAVTVDLHDIFTGIGMRGSEDTDQDIIHGLFPVHDRSVVDRIALCLFQIMIKDTVCDSHCLRTAHAYDGYRCFDLPCGYSCDRVTEHYFSSLTGSAALYMAFSVPLPTGSTLISSILSFFRCRKAAVLPA